MRFTVHAKDNREPIERRFANAIEATRDAWRRGLRASTSSTKY
jgi:hypothetical protein